MKNNFVFLIARQRSGTGALASILAQYPKVYYLSEIFHPDGYNDQNNFFYFLKNIAGIKDICALYTKREELCDRYFNWIIEKYPNKILIADIKYRSLDFFNHIWHSPVEEPTIFKYIRSENIKILHLLRSNFISTYVSAYLAAANNIYHTDNISNISVNSIHICPNDLLDYLKFTSYEVDFLSNIINTTLHIEIEYEKFFFDNYARSDYDQKIKNIFNIDIKGFLPTSIKQAPIKLQESIKNYQEIKKYLKNTAYYNLI